MRKARGAEPPADVETSPLVYQGGSGILLGPTDDIPLVDPAWGLDFEGEICAILGDTPRGVAAEDAGPPHPPPVARNDVTLRTWSPAS